MHEASSDPLQVMAVLDSIRTAAWLVTIDRTVDRVIMTALNQTDVGEACAETCANGESELLAARSLARKCRVTVGSDRSQDASEPAA